MARNAILRAILSTSSVQNIQKANGSWTSGGGPFLFNPFVKGVKNQEQTLISNGLKEKKEN